MPNLITPHRPSILSISYPDDGNLRARKVISRSKARPTGKYPSWKMGRMMHWESSHELNAYRLLDSNPEVVSFHEQPLTIRYLLGGEEHLHYPDVLVNFGGTRELWEIKTARDAADPGVVARTSLMQSQLPDFGFVYRVVIGEDLARNPRLSNVLKLLKYGRQPVSLVERESLVRILGATSEISWQAAIEALSPDGRRILARLCLEGLITCDMDQALTDASSFVLRNARKD